MEGEEFLQELVSKEQIDEIWNNFGLKNDGLCPERLIRFALGSRFMKRSYDGEFRQINDKILADQELLKKIYGADTFCSLRTEMRDCILIPVMAEMFARYRQAYRFDHDFIEALTGTDEVEIPLSTFTSLPFQTFYLDLDGYAPFQPFFGCLVTVSVTPETGLPDISILRFVNQDKAGETLIFSAYLTGDDFIKHGLVTDHGGEIYIRIKKDMIADDAERKVDIFARVQGAEPFYEQNMREFILFIMQAILYLGSYKPDIAKQPAVKETCCKNKEKVEKDVMKKTEFRKWDVGVRYGNAIRIGKKEMRRVMKRQESAAVSQRAPVRPHVRAAHWHTYWTGKGRTDRTVKWIPPVFVCGHSELPITVHNVETSLKERKG